MGSRYRLWISVVALLTLGLSGSVGVLSSSNSIPTSVVTLFLFSVFPVLLTVILLLNAKSISTESHNEQPDERRRTLGEVLLGLHFLTKGIAEFHLRYLELLVKDLEDLYQRYSEQPGTFTDEDWQEWSALFSHILNMGSSEIVTRLATDRAYLIETSGRIIGELREQMEMRWGCLEMDEKILPAHIVGDDPADATMMVKLLTGFTFLRGVFPDPTDDSLSFIDEFKRNLRY